MNSTRNEELFEETRMHTQKELFMNEKTYKGRGRQCLCYMAITAQMFYNTFEMCPIVKGWFVFGSDVDCSTTSFNCGVNKSGFSEMPRLIQVFDMWVVNYYNTEEGTRRIACTLFLDAFVVWVHAIVESRGGILPNLRNITSNDLIKDLLS